MAVSKKTAWIVSACGTAALILFFFVDLPVARQLYRPGTGFGAFFRVAAPLMPPLCGLLFSGCLARTTEEPVGWRLFGAASSAVYSAAGGFLFFYYLGVRRPVATLLLAAALFLGSMLLGGISKPDPAALRRAAAAAFVMIGAVFLTVEILKNIWGRPRFYAMTDPALQFTRWLFPKGKPVSDAFKSFPSGHTANGSAVLLLMLVSAVFPRAARSKTTLSVFVWSWIALTALSRMLEGMHFASDVTVGFLISFWTFCAVQHMVYRPTKI